MKHLMSLAAFLFGLTTALFSQVPTEKSLLWEISGKNLKEKSYLYGTFHILCKEDLAIDSLVFKKLESCKELYLELDLDDPAVQAEMAMRVMKPSGESIKQYVSEEEFKMMADSMRKISGYPLEPIAELWPLLTTSFLYQGIMKCATGSPEELFRSHATKFKIQTSGLETVARQMNVFERIPFKDQALMLKDYLLVPGLFKTQTEQMLGLYRSKDIPAMYAYMEEDEAYSQYLDILLFERNTEWVEKVKSISAAQPAFYAVGAGHLGGDYGVINLLRKEGYSVVAIGSN